jgi:hypothetical protein
MPGEQKPQLRIVGGNVALVRMASVSCEARWPPLRVVGAAEPAPSPVPVAPIAPIAVPASKRAARSQALLAGLVVVMLSSVGQAIADYL